MHPMDGERATLAIVFWYLSRRFAWDSKHAVQIFHLSRLHSQMESYLVS